jgi:hypothetical protein
MREIAHCELNIEFKATCFQISYMVDIKVQLMSGGTRKKKKPLNSPKIEQGPNDRAMQSMSVQQAKYLPFDVLTGFNKRRSHCCLITLCLLSSDRLQTILLQWSCPVFN